MKASIKIPLKSGIRTIGENQPTFIIAEAGSNHDQKLDQAKQLIDVAVESGSDAVKFQLFTAVDLVGKDHPAYERVKKAEMPRKWLPELVDYCDKKEILFMATPFDRQAVDMLTEINTPLYKWASSETTNLPLLAYAASRGKPILLSTGMCDMADIQDAITVLNQTRMQEIVLLQCVSVYPTEPKDVNLRVMDTLGQAFQYPVGLSDHSLGIGIPLAAVARGACVIEKHFTLSRSLQGPDHSYAIEPDELKQMVRHIREIEQSLGSPIKQLHPEESLYGRRDGIYASRDLPAGTSIRAEDVTIARPAPGVRAKFQSFLVGNQIKAPIAKGKPIRWEDLR